MKPIKDYTIFCSACGNSVVTNAFHHNTFGLLKKRWCCCSKDCNHEMEMRDVSSLMGEDYIQWSHKRKEND